MSTQAESKERRWDWGILGICTALSVLALIVGLRDLWVTTAQAETRSSIERGRYLVTIGGCNDCHTPWILGPKGPAPDMTRMLSGHPADLKMPPPPKLPMPWSWMGSASNSAFAGPWGVSYAINLTPDKDSGLGRWSEAEFVDALRTGKHKGEGRPILPPMPWPWYGKMTGDDLKAVFAYLRSIPPVRNQAPPAEIAVQAPGATTAAP